MNDLLFGNLEPPTFTSWQPVPELELCRLYLPNIDSAQACRLSNTDETGVHDVSGDARAKLEPYNSEDVQTHLNSFRNFYLDRDMWFEKLRLQIFVLYAEDISTVRTFPKSTGHTRPVYACKSNNQTSYMTKPPSWSISFFALHLMLVAHLIKYHQRKLDKWPCLCPRRKAVVPTIHWKRAIFPFCNFTTTKRVWR